MKFDMSKLEDVTTPEERASAFEAGLNIARKVKRGQITRDQAVEELVKMGDHPLIARNFLLHVLDQAELDEEYRRSGLITN